MGIWTVELYISLIRWMCDAIDSDTSIDAEEVWRWMHGERVCVTRGSVRVHVSGLRRACLMLYRGGKERVWSKESRERVRQCLKSSVSAELGKEGYVEMYELGRKMHEKAGEERGRGKG